MATTLNEYSTRAQNGLTAICLKLTAGAADTSVTYTHVAGVPLKGISQPVKTTGSAGTTDATYNESTGVLTITCGNNDVIRVILYV